MMTAMMSPEEMAAIQLATAILHRFGYHHAGRQVETALDHASRPAKKIGDRL